ncbi:hypothetical protein glysoja_010913 [Glycine soja]|nr:hypothetical protein glysoja_010913 [Glycine soja]
MALPSAVGVRVAAVAPPGNGFVCVCKGGYNTSLDCSTTFNQNQDYVWDSSSANHIFFTCRRNRMRKYNAL